MSRKKREKVSDETPKRILTATVVAVSHRNALRTLVELAFECDINVPAEDETEERPNLDFHEFDSVRGGRKIEQDVAGMDAAYGG